MVIPDSLADLCNLVKLNLSFNNLMSLPPAISGMKSKCQIVPGLADVLWENISEAFSFCRFANAGLLSESAAERAACPGTDGVSRAAVLEAQQTALPPGAALLQNTQGISVAWIKAVFCLVV